MAQEQRNAVPSWGKTELDTAEGTIFRVLSDGADGKPWRGLIHQGDTRRSLIVRLDAPPAAGIGIGSDLRLVGKIVPSGQADVPDEFRVSGPEARLASLMGGGASLVQGAGLGAATPGTLRETPALQLAAWGAGFGLLPKPDSGVIAVTRPTASRDEAISWATDRFSEEGAAQYRSALDFILEPTALFPGGGRVQPTGKMAAGVAAIRRAFGTEAPRFAPTLGATEIKEARPSGVEKGRWERQSGDVTVGNSIAAHTVGQFADGSSLAVVVPYDVSMLASERWRFAVTAFPMEFMPTRAANMIIAAHEMAHRTQDGLGCPPYDEDEKNRNLRECHADATALMLYILDTGDTASAEIWARQRGSDFFNSTSHATGLACHKAIKEAARMREEYGDAKVPAEAVINRALDIAEANYYHNMDDVKALQRRMDELEPRWREARQDRIADLAARAYTELRPSMEDADNIALSVDYALASLSRSTATINEMADPATRAKVEAARKADIVGTARYWEAAGAPGVGASIIQTSNKMMAQRASYIALGRNASGDVAARANAWATKKLDGIVPEAPGRVMAGIAAVLAGSFAGVWATNPITNISRRKIAQQVNALSVATNDTSQKALVRLKAASSAPPPNLFTVIAGSKPKKSLFDLSMDDRLSMLADHVENYANAASADRAAISNKMRAVIRSLRWDPDAWSDAKEAMSDYTRATIPLLEGDHFDPVMINVKALAADMRTSALRRELALHRRHLRGEPGGVELDWSGRDLRNVDLSGADLRGANLAGANLDGVNLRGTNLAYVNLDGANLQRASLQHAILDRADLRSAKMGGADLSNAEMKHVFAAGADLRNTRMRDAILVDADLTGANLRGADLTKASLRNAVTTDADLRGAIVRDTDFTDVILTFTRVNQPAHVFASAACSSLVSDVVAPQASDPAPSTPPPSTLEPLSADAPTLVAP